MPITRTFTKVNNCQERREKRGLVTEKEVCEAWFFIVVVLDNNGLIELIGAYD
jgi:hypothetical protein